MAGYRLHHSVEHRVGKKVGREYAPRRRGRLLDLVLDREIGLAGAASKLAVCCYIESVACYIYPVREKSIDERDE